MSASGDALDAVVRLADDLRREVVGDEVTYVVNRNINFTNVCYTGCRFCAFAQRATDVDAFTLSLEDVARRVREAVDAGLVAQWRCRVGNEASLRLADRLGFTRLGMQASVALG